MEHQNLTAFQEAFPAWKDGSHKRIRKVNGQPGILLAHALDIHCNKTVVDELESYERFYKAELRAAKTSHLIQFICKPLEEGKELPAQIRGLYGFFVEKIDGDRVKPLDKMLASAFDPKFADVIRSKSPLLYSVQKNKDHTELIKDIIKLYQYAKTNGVYDLQGIYDGTHFTLIDPPGLSLHPRAEQSQKLLWLLNCLNYFSSVKVDLTRL